MVECHLHRLQPDASTESCPPSYSEGCQSRSKTASNLRKAERACAEVHQQLSSRYNSSRNFISEAFLSSIAVFIATLELLFLPVLCVAFFKSMYEFAPASEIDSYHEGCKRACAAGVITGALVAFVVAVKGLI